VRAVLGTLTGPFGAQRPIPRGWVSHLNLPPRATYHEYSFRVVGEPPRGAPELRDPPRTFVPLSEANATLRVRDPIAPQCVPLARKRPHSQTERILARTAGERRLRDPGEPIGARPPFVLRYTLSSPHRRRRGT